nr:methylenetetrahydrofolate reductase C-terminal domain-containing protein [Oscillatoria laete-virens]
MMNQGCANTAVKTKRPNLAEKFIFHTEAFVKGMLFDCQTCGQCVLSKTGLVCPMSCPKGLRNGPCGGTLAGKCEVYGQSECVWVRIHESTGKDSTEPMPLLPPPDYNLFKTASYVNFIQGADRQARTPLESLGLPTARVKAPVQTASRLEARLKAGQFVRTCEIRSPRENLWKTFQKEAAIIQDQFDAVNATAYLSGKPSVSSVTAAGKLVELGIDAISQMTGRDQTRTTLVSELIENQHAGVDNILLLTGDSFVGAPKLKQVYDLDSSLMIYEARHMREKSATRFTGVTMKNPPRLFLGAAINPFTTPANIPIRRLKQKVFAGADFVQSQLIFDAARFQSFMADYRAAGLHGELFFLAGIPVVISTGALAMVPQIPGVHYPEEIRCRLESAGDLRAEGIALARELVQMAYETPGVNGVHLMLFGVDHTALNEVISVLPDREESFTQNQTTTTSTQKETLCHSPA